MKALQLSVGPDPTAPEPPYPSDTRAKGWRFELDYERISQSDTWDLAAEIPMAQPALLMLWMMAWQQTPCGSLPADESIIRAKCRIPVSHWHPMRDVLLRGWWLATDGRLYHDTIVERVREMMACRRKESDRKALLRARKPADEQRDDGGPPQDSDDGPKGVPRDKDGTDRGPGRESDTGTGTGTGTGTSTGTKGKERTDEVVLAGAASGRGTRLPKDWVLTKSWGEWAMRELGMSPERVRTEADRFRDYWWGKSGKDGTKVDWEATWRNWCRNARQNAPAAATKQSAIEARNAEVVRRIMEKMGAGNGERDS